MVTKAIECRLGGIRLPMTPTRLTPTYADHKITHQIIESGTIRTPRGREPRRMSFEVILPGYPRRNRPYVVEYQDPVNIINNIVHWIEANIPVRFTVQGTEIDWEVSISQFEPDVSGGKGDRTCRIQLEEVRRLTVGSASNPSPRPISKIGNPTGVPYQTTGTETWQSIAQKKLGDASRWREVQTLNPTAPVDDEGYVQTGAVIKLPS